MPDDVGVKLSRRMCRSLSFPPSIKPSTRSRRLTRRSKRKTAGRCQPWRSLKLSLRGQKDLYPSELMSGTIIYCR